MISVLRACGSYPRSWLGLSRDARLREQVTTLGLNHCLLVRSRCIGNYTTVLNSKKPGDILLDLFNPSVVRHHEEERIVPFSSQVVYQVAADVERYEEFVPFTRESCILRHTAPDEFIAELKIGFGSMKASYLSRVKCDPVKRIVAAEAEDSEMFNVLNTRWELLDRPLDKSSCLLRFKLDFEFKAAVHNHLAGTLFQKISSSMVDAFLKRCAESGPNGVLSEKKLYSGPAPSAIVRSLAQQKKQKTTPTILCELESLSHFSVSELERIKHDFDKRTGKSGTLGIKAFEALFLELFQTTSVSQSDIKRTAHEIFKALDLNHDNRLSLNEFTAGFSTVIKGTAAERSRFWFRCYDVDDDGLISSNELYNMVYYSIAVRNALLVAGAVNKPDSEKKTFLIDTNIHEMAKLAVQRCFGMNSDSRETLRSKDDVERVSLKDIVDKKIF